MEHCGKHSIINVDSRVQALFRVISVIQKSEHLNNKIKLFISLSTNNIDQDQKVVKNTIASMSTNGEDIC